MTGNKLRIFREFRNYSQEYVAEKLGITQNAYSRIETNQTKITTDRLQRLAELLEIPVTDLLSDAEPEINCSVQGKAEMKNDFLNFSKQLYDQIISTKDEKIALLEEEIVNLRGDREKMMRLIEKLTSSSLERNA
ncbi:MAG: helix-turn-helix transcriptional regulator [Chitinophagaceae bacterium]|nr:helix-turn-helix transcriptional regulator [Chitinophagaceae bacterium]